MIYFHKELPYLHLLILHLFFLKSNSTPQTFTEFSIDKVISNFSLYSSVNAFFLKYFLFWASTTPSPHFFFFFLPISISPKPCLNCWDPQDLVFALLLISFSLLLCTLTNSKNFHHHLYGYKPTILFFLHRHLLDYLL